MGLSARNRLSGTITDVVRGEVASEVVVELASGETVTATITRGSADRLDLHEGDEVDAVIKASEVMISND
jgi:molybdopterin-binding protein